MPPLFDVSDAELSDHLPLVLADLGTLSSYERLGGGTYNTGVKARLDDGREVVVKISPPSSAPHLGYEVGLLATEADYFRRTSPLGVKVPDVLATGKGAFAKRDHLVMSTISGRPLYGYARRRAGIEQAALRRELGHAVARAHQAPCTDFGYTHDRRALQGPTWPDAFSAMMTTLLDDADRFGTRMPVPAEQLRQLSDACRRDLAEVLRPTLVHFDLWEGNILVLEQGSAPALAGIIDAERSLHGDPVCELPSLSVLDERAKDPTFVADEDFLAGYCEVAGPLSVTKALLARLALYRIYLYLIMLVEVTPRRLAGNEAGWRQDVCSEVIRSHSDYLCSQLT